MLASVITIEEDALPRRQLMSGSSLATAASAIPCPVALPFTPTNRRSAMEPLVAKPVSDARALSPPPTSPRSVVMAIARPLPRRHVVATSPANAQSRATCGAVVSASTGPSLISRAVTPLGRASGGAVPEQSRGPSLISRAVTPLGRASGGAVPEQSTGQSRSYSRLDTSVGCTSSGADCGHITGQSRSYSRLDTSVGCTSSGADRGHITGQRHTYAAPSRPLVSATSGLAQLADCPSSGSCPSGSTRLAGSTDGFAPRVSTRSLCGLAEVITTLETPRCVMEPEPLVDEDPWMGHEDLVSEDLMAWDADFLRRQAERGASKVAFTPRLGFSMEDCEAVKRASSPTERLKTFSKAEYPRSGSIDTVSTCCSPMRKSGAWSLRDSVSSFSTRCTASNPLGTGGESRSTMGGGSDCSEDEDFYVKPLPLARARLGKSIISRTIVESPVSRLTGFATDPASASSSLAACSSGREARGCATHSQSEKVLSFAHGLADVIGADDTHSPLQKNMSPRFTFSRSGARSATDLGESFACSEESRPRTTSEAEEFIRFCRPVGSCNRRTIGWLLPQATLIPKTEGERFSQERKSPFSLPPAS
eukprot:TRINITY_DN7830_c0_g1_i7.p1 TRINITY_DN7830_c0_g1~~TRINITY_DN7830_c0_g1_i7.p1  ORF type:complete len:593 (+),score=57.70 TRINITY_DN7830_c0_g1_i7:147-1925(+)